MTEINPDLRISKNGNYIPQYGNMATPSNPNTIFEESDSVDGGTLDAAVVTAERGIKTIFEKFDSVDGGTLDAAVVTAERNIKKPNYKKGDSDINKTSYDYLKWKIEHQGEESLTDYEKLLWSSLCDVDKIAGGAFSEKIQYGSKTAESLCDDGDDVDRLEDGSIDINSAKNQEQIKRNYIKNHSKFEKVEERQKYRHSFDLSVQKIILSHLIENDMIDEIELDFTDKTLIMVSSSKNSSAKHQKLAVSSLKDVHSELKRDGYSTEGTIEFGIKAVESFDKESAAQIVEWAVEEELAPSVCIAAAKRSDAKEVFQLATVLIANNANISDEQKKLFEQTSSEILKTDSASKGDKSEKSKSDKTESAKDKKKEDVKEAGKKTDSQNVANTKDTKKVELKNSEKQSPKTVEKVLSELNFNKKGDREQLVELFTNHPTEMKKHLDRSSRLDKENIIVALCKSSAETTKSYVKTDASIGKIILYNPKIELGLQQDVAKVMVDICDKGSDEWKTASQFLGSIKNRNVEKQSRAPFESKA